MRIYKILNNASIKQLIIGALLVINCVACSSTAEDTLDNHEDVEILIDLESQTSSLNKNQYSIDSVCSLSMPPDKIYEISKLIVKDNKIYLLDSRLARTIFVFNTNGEYLYKLGERGRALYEYITEPIDFFVDKHDDVHVFDREGQKILVFKKDGSPVRVIGTRTSFPFSFGLVDYNKYAFCVQCPLSEKGNNSPALLFSDASGDNKKEILYLRNTYTYIPSERTFFKNEDRLSHIPILSDSVLVFKNDSIEKVIHFDFKGRFLAKEKPEIVTGRVTPNMTINYDGVWGLYQYQETDSLSMLEYRYNKAIMYWLKNKKNGKITNAKGILEGICPFSDYYLRGSQIVAIIDKETVNEMRVYAENDTFKKNLGKSSPQIIDVMEGKISTPAIFYISIK